MSTYSSCGHQRCLCALGSSASRRFFVGEGYALFTGFLDASEECLLAARNPRRRTPRSEQRSMCDTVHTRVAERNSSLQKSVRAVPPAKTCSIRRPLARNRRKRSTLVRHRTNLLCGNVARIGGKPHEMNTIATQIRSLEPRAASRDREIPSVPVRR